MTQRFFVTGKGTRKQGVGEEKSGQKVKSEEMLVFGRWGRPIAHTPSGACARSLISDRLLALASGLAQK